jgi:hypothetical protein
MMVEFQFVNQIIGVASGFRDVSLNHVHDRAVFELLDRNEADFPFATRDRNSVRPSNWRADLKYTTRWNDDSHWSFVSYVGNLKREEAMQKLGFLATSGLETTQANFPVGMEFREVVEDMRPQTIATIQDHLDRNVAVVGDAIWRRANEPCYGLKLIDNHTGRKLDGNLRASSSTRSGFEGQRFRLDDQETFREAVLDHTECGWALENSDGVVWSVPDMEILIPESIALEAEAQTIVDIAFNLRSAAQSEMKGMAYGELEAICLLRDAFETTAPFAANFDEVSVSEFVDPIRLLMRYRHRDELNAVSLALATDRWENRAIGDFLAVRNETLRF